MVLADTSYWVIAAPGVVALAVPACVRPIATFDYPVANMQGTANGELSVVLLYRPRYLLLLVCICSFAADPCWLAEHTM